MINLEMGFSKLVGIAIKTQEFWPSNPEVIRITAGLVFNMAAVELK